MDWLQGRIELPARSPDFTPLDFFYGLRNIFQIIAGLRESKTHEVDQSSLNILINKFRSLN